MRNIFKFSFLLCVFATLLISETGCLKDELADDQQTNPDIPSSSSIIELPGPVRGTTSYRTSYAVGLIASSKDTTINMVPVRLASDQPAPEDIQVELELAPTLLKAYNDSTGSNLIQPPANLYKFAPGLTITIPKGEREGFLQLTTKPNDFVGPEYGFGFRIKSVSNSKYLISGNFNTAVVIVGVRNKYDGDYNLRVKTVGWAAYGIADGTSGDYPEHISMITAGANSNDFFNEYFGAGFVPAFTSTGDPTGFGGTSPQFTFDPATDKIISITNTTPLDSRQRVILLNPNVTTSRFDPATKTIYAAYILKQTGRPDLLVYDTLTYVAPRP
jgi:hypothetical protein